MSFLRILPLETAAKLTLTQGPLETAVTAEGRGEVRAPGPDRVHQLSDWAYAVVAINPLTRRCRILMLQDQTLRLFPRKIHKISRLYAMLAFARSSSLKPSRRRRSARPIRTWRTASGANAGRRRRILRLMNWLHSSERKLLSPREKILRSPISGLRLSMR